MMAATKLNEVSARGTDVGATALHRLFWRVHFWAGLLCTPVVLFAVLTGLLYVWTPEIEAWRHETVDRVPVAAQSLPLDAQVEAATAAYPGQDVRFVVPAFQPGDTTQVVLKPLPVPGEHAGHGELHDHGLPSGRIVYVNPANAEVAGSLLEMQRFKTWAKRLHSSALQGNGWRWLMELGASWLLIMMVTGLVLWWPRSVTQGGRGWASLRPRWGRGRVTWRDVHALVGVMMGGVLAVLLITGLTWSRHAGDNFRQLQKTLGQESPRPSPGLKSSASEGERLAWQQAWVLARAASPDIALQITPPQGERGVWRVENYDRDQPTRRFNLALDAYTGELLFRSGWDQMPVLARATAVGIPFHRGEFGAWNRVLLVLAALMTLGSLVSGWVMWWLRRPAGAMAVPRLSWQQVRAVPAWVWAVVMGLGWALPVWGLSALALAAAEGLAWGFRRWGARVSAVGAG